MEKVMSLKNISVSMEIISMSWKVLKVPLKKPFKIALGTIENYEGVIVKICTEEYCGYGEASPSPKIVGDTVDTVVAALGRFEPLIIGEDVENYGRIMETINRSMVHNSSAKAAIDFALFDILAQRANLPVKSLLGGKKDRIETSLTVDISSVEKSVKHAEELLSQGAKVLKVKIGLNPQEDIERIRAIRKITDARIRVDGNQGYSLNQAIKVLNAIDRYEIEFAEQPLPVGHEEELKILREKVPLPIMADESVHDSRDVLNLIGKVDAINIKLMKSGGIYEALKMASIARAAGMKIMVGCMIETKLAIAAGTHFALGVGVDYADLDGYWDLKEQPFEGDIYRDGYNYAPEKSGLGATPIKDLL